MNEPLLIDTSIWVDFFNGVDSDNVNVFSHYLENDFPIFICPVIIQEILQGIKSNKEYRQVKDCLFALNVLNDDSIEAALGAVKIYRKLREKGITIRKSNDCLIAYYAIKYSLKILHRDRDFDNIIKYYN
ncbi:MAG: PIN domain-containing protein [Bacteroidota bacterium]